jgi:hypothetical protein
MSALTTPHRTDLLEHKRKNKKTNLDPQRHGLAKIARLDTIKKKNFLQSESKFSKTPPQNKHVKSQQKRNQTPPAK